MATNAADTDELTGLVNARYLFAHLQHEVARNSRSGESFAVILLDLDGFKSANDQYGHLAGHRILRAVSAGLRRNCRAGDVVARLGGDELPCGGALRRGRARGRHARADGGNSVNTANRQADMQTADITFKRLAGVSRFPDDGMDAESLLAKADERMYEAKRRKKLTIVPQEYLASKPEAAAEVAVE